MNLFIVVETGDHHVTVLDGDKLEPIHRFPSRYALHGGPKFTPDGRYVFFASRDGWITKFDIWNLKVVAECAPASTPATPRSPATASGWRWPTTCRTAWSCSMRVDLSLVKIMPVTRQGRQESFARFRRLRRRAASELRRRAEGRSKRSGRSATTRRPNRSPRAWSTTSSTRKALHPRLPQPAAHQLDDYLDDFFFTQSYDEMIGASRNGKSAVRVRWSISMPARRSPTSTCPACRTSAPASPGHGRTPGQSRTVMATPNLNEGLISGHRHETWKNRQADQDPRPGLLHAQPREQPLRFHRLDDEQGKQERSAGHRQAEPGSRRADQGQAGTDAGPRRVHSRTAATRWPACGRWTARWS
jgi:hypothetical protein